MNCLNAITKVKQRVDEMNFAHIYPYFQDGSDLTFCTQEPRVSLVLAHHLYNGGLGSPYGRMTKTHLEECDLLILDNGAFEGEMLSADKLITVTRSLTQINAACKFAVIAPDYPGQDPKLTIDSAKSFHRLLVQEGLRERVFLFFVPQGRPHNIDDYVECLEFAQSSSIIEGVCFSILACPYAVYGTGKATQFTADARVKLLNYLHDTHPHLLADIFDSKYVHFLGLFNSTQECDEWKYRPNSFDSAAPLKMAYYVAINDFETTDKLKFVPKIDVDVISQSDQVIEAVCGNTLAKHFYLQILHELEYARYKDL